MSGKIELVGAGPGNPDLLTLAAYRAITTADIVLSDRLVPKAILNLNSGEIRIAAKYPIPGQADKAQDELDQWGLEALKKGKYVIRLKNGDPFVFGRGGEEVEFYKAHGYRPGIIPGISSSLASATTLSIPSTLRDVADQLLICTGHGKKYSYPILPEYCAHRTTVFLMSIGRLQQIATDLIQTRGYPATIPVAVIQNATMENQKSVCAELQQIARVVEEHKIKPPATVIIGHVVEKADLETPCQYRATKLRVSRSRRQHSSLVTSILALPLYLFIAMSVISLPV